LPIDRIGHTLMAMQVLVVDDHWEVRDLLLRALARDGHHVRLAVSVRSAEALYRDGELDVAIVDHALPDGTGTEFCRALRRRGSTLPILLLTAHGEVSQRVASLDAGADDFLAKPFAVAELRARVRALGRRGPRPRNLVHRSADLELDVSARRAFRAGKEVGLTAREWAVIELLIRASGRVVSRPALLEIAWGEDTEGTNASLEVIVARLRRKLGDATVRTIRGEGYAFGH
jgi:two-component system, OmpR family, response regulator